MAKRIKLCTVKIKCRLRFEVGVCGERACHNQYVYDRLQGAPLCIRFFFLWYKYEGKEQHQYGKNIGIEIAPFGINAFRVTSIPVWMKEADVNDYIEDIVEQVLSSNGKIKLGDLRLKAISTLACKASLKANKNLSMQEMQVLLDNLFTCNNPFTCPHGRPIMIVYSDYELDKMFRRVV